MNKNQYLLQLAKQILSVKNSLSKVYFAKLIYFVHKGLVQKGLSKKEDLKFIRMPLGPVPVGFRGIKKDSGIQIKEEDTGLIYNKQIYCLSTKNDKDIKDERYDTVKIIVNNLSQLSTSELVEHSHNEPSWKGHENSEEYYLENNDLKRSLPQKERHAINPELDDQKLQALLLSGMMDEIVEDSTSLEYPQK